MPWVMGGAESANKMVKRVFQLNYFLEFTMYTINSRPIGLSTSDEAVCPIDIIPLWSQLEPKTMAGASGCLLEVMATFTRKWEELYLLVITQQSKWFTSNHELGEGDIVFIRDLMTERGTSRLARISKIDLVIQGTECYFDCQYKVRVTGKFKTV